MLFPRRRKQHDLYTRLPRSTDHLVPIVDWLVHKDLGVEEAYLCKPSVPYVERLPGDGCGAGHLCGYYNMQMLLASIPEQVATGKHQVAWPQLWDTAVPNVLTLQGLLECAWDAGIEPHRRDLIGSVKATSKHIGTAEVGPPNGRLSGTVLTMQQALAVFTYLQIPCEAKVFTASGQEDAYDSLVAFVWTYFKSGAGFRPAEQPKCHSASVPPLYLQRPGHSLTIVGVEKRKDGTFKLLAFDPGNRPSTAMKVLLQRPDASATWAKPSALLRQFRLREKAMRKYKAFELLQLLPTQAALNES